MMAIKKALVVDDSKSARAVLKRMLKELALEVDTVESAADAIDYLKDNRPDVIFMDHMMPGMDGFEAVKHIKNNPETAVIPIMMYTSKAGDVYLSQARELGAVGIISKTISPVGLKESLFKLGLVDDRRISSTLERDKPASAYSAAQVTAEKLTKKHKKYHVDIEDLQRLMDEQTIELHKSMWLGIESVSHEIFNRLNKEREEILEKILSASVEKNKASSWPVYIVAVMLLLSIFFNASLFTDIYHLEKRLAVSEEKRLLAEEVSQSADKKHQTAVRENLIAAEGGGAEESIAGTQYSLIEFTQWAQGNVIEYPYDELALNDDRINKIDELLEKAIAAGFVGNIVLQTHVGRFCLNRDQGGDFVLAAGSMPVTDCEYIGNHVQPGDTPSTQQSLGFANYLSDKASLIDKSISIEVASISRLVEISEYPEQTPQTSVDDWNRAAQLNNRITFKLTPASVE
jgi:CheY-like chemotaxis protein